MKPARERRYLISTRGNYRVEEEVVCGLCLRRLGIPRESSRVQRWDPAVACSCCGAVNAEPIDAP